MWDVILIHAQTSMVFVLDPSHKSHSALDKYCIPNAPFCNRNVHISVTKWCIVGYGTDALWDLFNRPITSCSFLWDVITYPCPHIWYQQLFAIIFLFAQRDFYCTVFWYRCKIKHHENSCVLSCLLLCKHQNGISHRGLFKVLPQQISTIISKQVIRAVV